MRPSLLAVLAVAMTAPLGACGGPAPPPLATAADSLAFQITEGAGGLAAWDALRGLEFEWAVVRDSAELARNRHVWDKHGDRARTEWRAGADSVMVAVFTPSTFDPDAPTGRVGLDGTELTGPAASERLVEAYGRFVNDGYWLLAPLKVFDPGVRRSLDTGSGFDRLAIAFDSVGLTPGDRYWIETDPVTGGMTGWSYILQSGNEGAWEWLDPTELETKAGPVVLARTKVSADGRSVIFTEPRALTEIDEAEFTDLMPRLSAR